VSDLPYTAVANGWGPVEKDTSNGEQAAGDGHTLTLHGVTYAKGLGVHPNSEVDVPLKGAYSTFVSDIGIDDEVLPNRASPVDFQVWADGVKLFDSGTMTNASATQHVNVDVTGRSLLALKVIYTGSNNWYDHADWAGARLFTTPTPTPTPTLPSPISGTNYQLVWSDEFNGTSVDASKWNKVGWGFPVASHWANFSYLTSNVSEANGLATITAQKSGSNWTGGILSTDTTKMFQYGFVEVRAKLPKVQGFWPAIWLYGGSTADELDMMEFLGGDVSTVYQSYHFIPRGVNMSFPKSSDWTSDYHLFQMKWEPGNLTYYIDNVQTAHWTTSIPARQMYLMLNFDVGGPNDWGGAPNSSTPTTATLNVDYVRVYQQR
jgi:beta-glucanase (GH16 family)